MENKVFNIGTKIESNTYYKVDKEMLEYFKKDTIPLENPEYICSTNRFEKELNTAIYINEKENVVLDFNGAMLYLNGPLAPIIIANSKNVEIKNIVVKYDRSFFTQMEVIDINEGYLKVKVDERHPYIIEDGRFIPYSNYFKDDTLKDGFAFLQEFDTKTRKGISWPVVLIGNKEKDKCELPWGGETCSMLAYQEDEYVVFKGKNIPPYKVGSTLILTLNNRDISNAVIYNSEDIKITNYRIVNGLGMGLLPVYTKNLTIDGLKLFYDELSEGFASNCADGIHAVSLKGDLILKNSIISGTIDDALNIHSNYYLVDSFDKNILYATCPGPSDLFKIFDVGDEIEIYNEHTMEGVYSGKILELTRNDKKYKFVLDKELNEYIKSNSLIENMSTHVNVHINNCKFIESNPHLRFQTRGKVLVENCYTEMDLLLTGDTNYWFEASPVKDIIVRNVEFDTKGHGFGSIPEFKSSIKAPYYHSNVLVENCKFHNNLGLYMRFTDDIKFINNTNVNEEKFDILLDQCGSFYSDKEQNVRRVSQKSDRDE